MLKSPVRWWQLYGLAGLMIAALVWVHALAIGGTAETGLQVGILIVAFGLMFAWLGANQTGFLVDAGPAQPAADYSEDSRLAPEPEAPWAQPERSGGLAGH